MPADPSEKVLKFGSRKVKDEKVDERILRLLDLPSGHTIDYKTYHQRLKGKIRSAAVRKIAPEELALLSNEAKRISGRTDRFRIVSRSVKIATTSNISTARRGGRDNKSKDGTPPSGPRINAKNILPPRGGEIVPYQQPQAEIQPKANPFIKAFDSINNSLGKVYTGLLSQNKEAKRQEELDRREREGRSREARESRLESIFQGLVKTAEVVMKPFKSMFDRIIDYFFNVFLGTTLLKLINWMNNPKNEEKLNAIKRFLTDHGPKLIGAYLLFGTKFGRMVTSLAATLVTQLARLAKHQPVLASAMIAAGLITKVASDDRRKRDAEKLQRQQRYAELITGKTERGTVAPGAYGPAVTETPKIVPTRRYESGGEVKKDVSISKFLKSFQPPVDRTKRNIKDINASSISHKNQGHITESSGINITGAGSDTQLIAAQPGEIVIPKKAVSLYGSDFFMNLIRKSGSTGIPKFSYNVQLANQGGPVGGVMTPPKNMVGDVSFNLNADKNLNQIKKPIPMNFLNDDKPKFNQISNQSNSNFSNSKVNLMSKPNDNLIRNDFGKLNNNLSNQDNFNSFSKRSSNIATNATNATNNSYSKVKTTPGNIIDKSLNNFLSDNKKNQKLEKIPYNIQDNVKEKINPSKMGTIDIKYSKIPTSNFSSPNESIKSFVLPNFNLDKISKDDFVTNEKVKTPNLTQPTEKSPQQISNKQTIVKSINSSPSVTNKFNFISKEPNNAPQPPSSSKITFVDLPPEIVNSPQPKINKGINSRVDVPTFTSSVDNENRMTNIKIYFS